SAALVLPPRHDHRRALPRPTVVAAAAAAGGLAPRRPGPTGARTRCSPASRSTSSRSPSPSPYQTSSHVSTGHTRHTAHTTRSSRSRVSGPFEAGVVVSPLGAAAV